MSIETTCRNPGCRKKFEATRSTAKYCSNRCKLIVTRGNRAAEARALNPLIPWWIGAEPKFGVRAELADALEQIAREGDNGDPKTGRRFFYLALSAGAISPSMEDTDAAKKERDAAYKRVINTLGDLRKAGRVEWDAVLDLTREIDTPFSTVSPAALRATMRAMYDEDRWGTQRHYPMLAVEKDTLEPTLKPLADKWRMPFLSSRGYSSLTLQHEVAQIAGARFTRYGQTTRIMFVSDLDPSGIDLQRAWEQAMDDFGAPVTVVRVGLTPEQVACHGLEKFSIGVKDGDSRSKKYIAEYGNRCWEADVLPAKAVSDAIDAEIRSFLNVKEWNHRDREIEAVRATL